MVDTLALITYRLDRGNTYGTVHTIISVGGRWCRTYSRSHPLHVAELNVRNRFARARLSCIEHGLHGQGRLIIDGELLDSFSFAEGL